MRRAILVCSILAWSSATARAQPAAEPPCQLGFDGCYLDLDGRPRLAAPVYDGLVRTRSPALLRAAIEEALALGAGTAWYWIDRERQVADWDFPSIKQRLTFEAWRYDNNPFDINFFWHPFNGAGFHVLARSNDLSLPASFGYGFATSMVWEYVLEFREKVSINDVIATPAAGVAFGEFFHWLGRYLNSAPAGERAWHDSLRWTLGFWRSAHNALDHAGDLRTQSAPDNLGLSSDIWHRFNLSYTAGSAAAASTERSADDNVGLTGIRLRGELVAIPGYRRPGRFTQFFADGNVSRLRVDLGVASDGSTRDIRGDVLLLGWHRQDLPDPATDRVGHAVTAGVSLAYHYQRDDVGEFRDRVGLVHLPGPGVEALWRGPGWQLEVGARGWADFVGIYALPYDRWKAKNPDADEKAILRKQQYYYGWGGSGAGWAELTLPRVQLGASVLAGYYESHEGLDRSQEDFEDDIASTDSLVDYEAWLRLFPSGGRWYVEGRLRGQERASELDGLDADQSLTSYLLELGVQL